MQRKNCLICLVVFSLMLLLSFFSFPTISQVHAEEPYFAKAISKTVKLYRSTSGSEDFTNVYFTIPQSYYVEIDKCDNNLFFSARYIDVYGYVKKTDVQCVSGIPETPFANATFRVFVPGGIELRSSPTQSQGLNTIEQIGYLETSLKFYGEIEGEEAITNRTSTWFFANILKAEKNLLAMSITPFAIP